ncbi:Flp family type IVb pilin [Propionivibrio sp.]|uniref:Flp family type IVb pilin n=1 Tax=Propionivibrio sp. TaxID=2212460 RepID=UPI002F42B547
MINSVATAYRVMNEEGAKFARDEAAVTSIEYALIAALIAIVIVVSIGNVGTAVMALYEMVAEEVAKAASGL